MAACTLDLSRPCFIASLASIPETDEVKKEALDAFREKVEKDHRCCHHVVQKFWGNKKYTHLHGKIWKYDWGESSASSRKAWRMVVVVPEPDIQPYNLIGAAVYMKSIADQLSAKELAAIFGNATKAEEAPKDIPKGEFHRVPNGDGKIRSICGSCYCDPPVAVTEDIAELDKAEAAHRCDLAAEESAN